MVNEWCGGLEINILARFYLSSANAFNLVQSKVLLLDKELILSKSQILDSSIFKEFADYNLELYKNGRKFSSR